jgi:2-polyprenyl-6-hydroxyphenyl methylase/3-demethylubiquinone-9 3-methyltransferase
MAVDPDIQDSSETSPAAFAFGKNWSRFLSTLNEERIAAAQRSLQSLLKCDDLQNRSFLDAGSGSGLFSLAAARLGASVTSFDVDPESVACAQQLKGSFCRDSVDWIIRQGSLADRDFLDTLGEFNVVYCWGVAHHTGNMWQAIENLVSRIKPNGSLVLAIYNDQLYVSRIWRGVTQIYQKLPKRLRPIYVAAIGVVTTLKRFSVTLLAGLLRLITFRNPLVPFLNWARESQSRGMHAWYDLVDWVGGWPFEVARPEEVFRFLRDRGFSLSELTTSAGHGCNEFVFVREGHALKQTGGQLR